jgi:hypothetical protein
MSGVADALGFEVVVVWAWSSPAERMIERRVVIRSVIEWK